MERPELDAEAFARLRGKRDKPGGRRILLVGGVLFLAGFLVLLGPCLWVPPR